MSFSFEDRIQSLWRSRFLQRHQEVRQGLGELRSEPSKLAASQSLELTILEASLLRSSGEIEKSNQALQDVQEQNEELPFQFYIQRGINLFVDGEYSLALEYFVRAQKRSQNDFEALAASSNGLLCLENLNFETSGKLAEVRKILARLQDPEISAMLDQFLVGFAQRQAFREGEISKIYRNKDEKLSQAFYYRQWVAQLPFVKTAQKQDPSQLAALFAEQELHLKNFRLKTLLADPRLVDEGKVELREYIDRLYLWTWRWLTSKEACHSENLQECLGQFPSHSFHKKMTSEDILMMRNSFGWILLFQPQGAKFIEPILGVLSSFKIPTTPVFEIEEMLIHYLRALQKKEKAKASVLAKKIRAHDLYHQSGLLFADWMTEFSKRVQAPNESKNGTSIDLGTYKITHQGQVTISEPLVNLIGMLLTRDSLLFSEALEIAFGIPDYEEEVHKTKIYNLLSRLRGILPGKLKVLTRQGRIYLQGDKSCVSVRKTGPSLIANPLQQAKKPVAELKKAALDRWVHPQLILKKVAGQRSFTRQELQELAQTSKATLNRWIQKWLQENLIKKTGQGKSTRYFLEMP